MTYKNLFLLVVLFLCINACSKKDKDRQSVLESYQSNGPLIIDQLAIYTRDGVNTDPVVIQGYIDRNVSEQHNRDLFHVNRTSVDDHDIGKELRFLEGGMVELNGKKMEVVSKTDTLMVIAELDSSDMPVTTGSDCWDLLRKVPEPAYSAAGACPSGSCSRYRKRYPVIILNGDYYLPTLYFGVNHVETSGFIMGFPVETSCLLISQEYPMVNFLSKDFRNELGSRDSVLVEVGRLRMVKK